MVEAALVSIAFFMLVFGIMEIGLLFRNTLTTNNASREGARSASAQGRDPDADYLTIRTVEHGMQAMNLQNLNMVVVFKADGPGAPPPGQCMTQSVPNLCNRYVPADFFAEKEDADGNPTGEWGCGIRDVEWCPTDREAGALVGPDYIGVFVQTQHNYMTGFFGDSSTIEATTVLRIEPDSR